MRRNKSSFSPSNAEDSREFREHFKMFFLLICTHYVQKYIDNKGKNKESNSSKFSLRTFRDFVDRLLVIYRIESKDRQYEEFVSAMHKYQSEQEKLFERNVYSEGDLDKTAKVMKSILNACFGYGTELSKYKEKLEEVFGNKPTSRRYLGLTKDSIYELLNRLSNNYRPAKKKNGESGRNSVFVNHLVVLSVQQGDMANSNSNGSLRDRSQHLLRTLMEKASFIRPGVGINPLISRRVNELRTKQGVSSNSSNMAVIRNDLSMDFDKLLANRVFTHRTVSMINELRDFARLQYAMMVLHKKIKGSTPTSAPVSSPTSAPASAPKPRNQRPPKPSA